MVFDEADTLCAAWWEELFHLYHVTVLFAFPIG